MELVPTPAEGTQMSGLLGSYVPHTGNSDSSRLEVNTFAQSAPLGWTPCGPGAPAPAAPSPQGGWTDCRAFSAVQSFLVWRYEQSFQACPRVAGQGSPGIWNTAAKEVPSRTARVLHAVDT